MFKNLIICFWNVVKIIKWGCDFEWVKIEVWRNKSDILLLFLMEMVFCLVKI